MKTRSYCLLAALGLLLCVAVAWAQSPVTIADSSKPAVETLQTIARRIGECPKTLDGEIRWGKKADEIERFYVQPPANVVWDVVAGNSVRAPYLGYVEFTTNEDVWVPESAEVRFQKSPVSMANSGMGSVSTWHFRYEYDLGPNGLQLTRALWRRKSTDGWADVNRGTAANYCSDAAARDTQAKANSQPDRGGQGAPQDYAQAASFRAAAEQGDAVAQNNLGIAYDLGHGAPQDDAQAAVWFRKAAEQGDAVAQNNLGVLYETGHGVPQDYAQAAVWYRKAAEQGYAIAQYTLGICYLHGQGVPQDNAQEAIWLRKAAEQGYANAQFYLGIAYGLGHGVPEDDAEAYFWIDLGTAGKIEGVKQEDIDRARNDAASLLTPANLSLVQERVKKWLEDHPAKP